MQEYHQAYLSAGAKAYEPEGLSDGGHVYPRCTNCRAILMDVFVTRPKEPTEWKVRAMNCPFCDDHPRTRGLGGSDPVLVRGGFHAGGYGRDKQDDESDDVPSTVIHRDDVEGDTFRFFLLKASPQARAFYD